MCESAHNLEILLISTRFLARGDKKWHMNTFLTHKIRCTASLTIKVQLSI
jgi:hypothetical protein